MDAKSNLTPPATEQFRPLEAAELQTTGGRSLAEVTYLNKGGWIYPTMGPPHSISAAPAPRVLN